MSSNAKYQARGGAQDGLRHQDLRDLLAKKIVRREVLYSDFITESARLLVDAGAQYERSSEIDTGLRAPESHST